MNKQGSTHRSSLAERLTAGRRRRFVGREEEKHLFSTALQAPEPPFAVLHIYGPGGVGKSTLVAELAALARESGARTVQLDGREVEASPEGFFSALRLALGLEVQASPLESLAAPPRTVLTDLWIRYRTKVLDGR